MLPSFLFQRNRSSRNEFVVGGKQRDVLDWDVLDYVILTGFIRIQF